VKIVYTQAAISDLGETYEYLISRDAVHAARRIDAAIVRAIDRLAAREFDGPISTLRSGARVRSWPVPRFRVVHQRDDDVLVILGVYHQSRRPLDE
jgi:plasmid stabilization system protein ParE